MINDNINAIISAALSDEPQDKIQYRMVLADAAAELLVSDFKQSLESYINNVRIYRGDKNLEQKTFDSYLGIPGNRISQNTSNMYTKLLSDVLDSWKDYPRRSNSFICTSDKDKALSYSDKYDYYAVFPENNAKFGICSKKDFWVSFPVLKNAFGITTMREFNTDFKELLFGVNYWLRSEQNKNLQMPSFVASSGQEIIEYFSIFDEEVKKAWSSPDTQKSLTKTLENELVLTGNFDPNTHLPDMIIDNIAQGKSTYDLLNDYILNPAENNFKCVTGIYNIAPNDIKNREIWTDAKCLFVRNGEDDETIITRASRLYK